MKTDLRKTHSMPFVLTAATWFLVPVLPTDGATPYYWYNIGPAPINTPDTLNNVVEIDSGRVTTLAVDPSNSDHWLIGAAQGGIWETFDRGGTLYPRTDDQASMAMGAIAAHKLRAALTLLGVVVGVFSIIVTTQSNCGSRRLRRSR